MVSTYSFYISIFSIQKPQTNPEHALSFPLHIHSLNSIVSASEIVDSVQPPSSLDHCYRPRHTPYCFPVTLTPDDMCCLGSQGRKAHQTWESKQMGARKRTKIFQGVRTPDEWKVRFEIAASPAFTSDRASPRLPPGLVHGHLPPLAPYSRGSCP